MVELVASGMGLCLLLGIVLALVIVGPQAVVGPVLVGIILGGLGWFCSRRVRAGGLLGVVRFLCLAFGFLWLLGALLSLILYVSGLL